MNYLFKHIGLVDAFTYQVHHFEHAYRECFEDAILDQVGVV